MNSSIENNNRFAASTDTSLKLGMLADQKKLRNDVDINNSSTSDDNNINIMQNNNIDSPDSFSFNDSDLHIDNSIKANSDEFKTQKMMFDNERSSRTGTPSEFKSNINNNFDIKEGGEVPYHMLDERSKKMKRMEKYAQLIRIQNSGIKLTKKYDLNSDYDEMCFEVKFWTDYQNKKDAVNLSKSFMLNAIQGIEFLNERYDPFGLKLKGWHDQVQVCSDSYNDVFGELYENIKEVVVKCSQKKTNFND